MTSKKIGFFFSLLLMTNHLNANACANWIDKIDGTYVARNVGKQPPKELGIHITEIGDEFDFHIESSWANSGHEDAPNIGNFEGKALLKGCLALYQGEGVENGKCSIVFSFQEKNVVNVVSFGMCNQGYNAYPDGKFRKTPN